MAIWFDTGTFDSWPSDADSNSGLQWQTDAEENGLIDWLNSEEERVVCAELYTQSTCGGCKLSNSLPM